jgi:SagB-type dehydrogenase family enzyme
MAIGRRDFFKWVGGLPLIAAATAAASQPAFFAPAIHHQTRNTRFGAVGARSPRGPAGPPFKRYPRLPRFQLPESTPLTATFEAALERANRIPRDFSGTPLSLDAFSALLHLTNGVTGRFPVDGGTVALRAAPSAGALYSGEVYVAVDRVSNVEPGLYYYALMRHRIVKLRAGSVASQIAATLETPDAFRSAPAVVFLTNVFGRYTRQYANRGYRYSLIDSGHIGENLRLAAAAAGLGSTTATRFLDEPANALLGIDGVSEAVCSFHAIGETVEENPPATPARRVFSESGRDTASANTRVTLQFHHATRLVANGPPAPAPDPRRELPENPSNPLPATETSGFSLATAIVQRRSAEAFSGAVLEPVELGAVLRAALPDPAHDAAVALELFVIAHRVRSMKAGVYRYRPETHRLGLWRAGEMRSEMVRACLGQKMAGTAAAGLVMAAPIGSRARSPGARDYRDRLMGSGQIAQRIYLAAEARGLAARNLAAFVDDRFNALCNFERDGLYALHLTMLGREA